MKEHYISTKINKGTHYVFESTTEAIKYLTSSLDNLNVNKQDLSNELTAFPRWFEANKGDWAKADDGAILQCLNRWDRIKYRKDGVTMRTFKSSQQPVETRMFVYVIGRYSIWNKSDGSWAPTKMWGMPNCFNEIKINRYKMGDKTYFLGKYKTHKKIMYAIEWVLTNDPFIALDNVIKKFKLQEYETADSRLAAWKTRTVLQLMSDPYVRDELKKLQYNMDDFKQNIKLSLEKHGLSPEDSIAAIKDMLDNGKAGMAKLKAAEMNLNIQRFVSDDSNTLNIDGSKVGSNGKGIEDAKFVEVTQGQAVVIPELPKKIEQVQEDSFEEKLKKAVANAKGNISVDDILPAE